jgi:polyphosphate kinase 2 (PPK2 family)
MAGTHAHLDDLIDDLRVGPRDDVDLRKRPTDLDFGMDKEAALARLAETRSRIDVLQQRLYAEGTRSVLLVVQAMDAAGKDGTIRNVLTGLNPAGIHVTSFKAPGGPRPSTTTSGGSTRPRPGGATSRCSTAATTRTCSSCG